MLFIHAGTGKTGTTFLQNFLASSAGDLGYLYPDTGRVAQAQSIMSGHHRLALNYQGANSKHEWCKLIDHIKKNDSQGKSKWIVSTENLTYASGDFIQWISSELDRSKITHEYILFVRDTASYAVSTFLEYVKVGRVPLYFSINDFLKVHIKSMFVENLISKFATASGDRLFLIDYNSSRKKGTLLSDFFNATKVIYSNAEEPASLKLDPRKNPSLYPELANCFTFLALTILEGIKCNQNPNTILKNYFEKIEEITSKDNNLVSYSSNLGLLILKTIEYAQQKKIKNYILASHASGLVCEFNKALKSSSIKLKSCQADLSNITLSEYFPQIVRSSMATQSLIQVFNNEANRNATIF